MTALQEERKEKLGDMSDILEKRDSIGKQIQACHENPGGLFGRIVHRYSSLCKARMCGRCGLHLDDTKLGSLCKFQ